MSLLISGCVNLEIAGSGSAFLEGDSSVLSNRDLWLELLGSNYEEQLEARGWEIESPEARHGVSRRHWLRNEEQHAGHLATAAISASQDAGIRGEDFDLVVTATATPPRITSSLAGFLGRALGLSVASFDVRAGGVGGLLAWITALRYLRHDASLVLVVAAETPSRYCNRDDLGMTSLLGDGAGAIVLRRVPDDCPGGQFLGGGMGSVPSSGEPWTVPGPLPPSRQAIEDGLYQFNQGGASYNRQLRALRLTNIDELKRAHAAFAAQCRFFLPNVPSRAQAEAELEALGNRNAQIITTLHDHGYLGAAGPLVALDQLRKSRQLRSGDTLLFTAVAGGIHAAWLFWKA